MPRRRRTASLQVHEWIMSTGVENIGKRLVNSREGKVEFEKPVMALGTLMKYGNALVEEQVRTPGVGGVSGLLGTV